MKIKGLFLIAFLSLLCCINSHAQVGDVVGNIYTTDIAADIDGMPIKSYNIGGKTAVVLEDLREYGFFVEWNPYERTLAVKTEYKPWNIPTYSHIKQTPGEVIGNIYETDIKATINGIEVLSYNLGGKTAVAIEDMVDLPGERYSYDGNAHQGMDKPYSDTGMYYVWNQKDRTISLCTLRPGMTVKTDCGDFIITSNSWSVERLTYTNSAKALATRDGKYVANYAEAFEIDGVVYLSLADVAKILNTTPVVSKDKVVLDFNSEDFVQVQYSNSLTARTCFNILYQLKPALSMNGAEFDCKIIPYADFYLYKGKVFVAISSVNALVRETTDKALFNDRYDLPEECGESIGKTLYSKHILYINGRAISSFLADNGEYYIPVDELSRAAFGIDATVTSRDITTPAKLPELIGNSNNYPSNIFFEDYENKGYHCEYYESLHKVTVDGKPISSIYLHYPDTHLTPLIPLNEFVETAGYSIDMVNGNIYVYTRPDRVTLCYNDDSSAILMKQDEKVIKEFSIYDYHNIGIYGDYICLQASGNKFMTAEIYTCTDFEKIAEVKGYVYEIADEKIYAHESTDVNGEWARQYHVYDMRGQLLESYIADK